MYLLILKVQILNVRTQDTWGGGGGALSRMCVYLTVRHNVCVCVSNSQPFAISSETHRQVEEQRSHLTV